MIDLTNIVKTQLVTRLRIEKMGWTELLLNYVIMRKCHRNLTKDRKMRQKTWQ